jgi:hypothetical protein
LRRASVRAAPTIPSRLPITTHSPGTGRCSNELHFGQRKRRAQAHECDARAAGLPTLATGAAASTRATAAPGWTVLAGADLCGSTTAASAAALAGHPRGAVATVTTTDAGDRQRTERLTCCA